MTSSKLNFDLNNSPIRTMIVVHNKTKAYCRELLAIELIVTSENIPVA